MLGTVGFICKPLLNGQRLVDFFSSLKYILWSHVSHKGRQHWYLPYKCIQRFNQESSQYWWPMGFIDLVGKSNVKIEDWNCSLLYMREHMAIYEVIVFENCWFLFLIYGTRNKYSMFSSAGPIHCLWNFGQAYIVC